MSILVFSAGCDLPTRLPEWETTWELVVARDTVRTVELLPPEMRAGPEGLRIDSFLVRDSVRLGEVCELCTCFDGPVPRLQLEPQDWSVRLPSRLIEAPLDRGTAILRLVNGLGFDLLDDGRGNLGLLRAQLVDRRTGDTLVSRVVQRSFPEGDTLAVEFPLAGVVAHGGLVVRVSGTTPGSSCDDLSLDPDDGLNVDVELSDLGAPFARVIVTPADLEPPVQRAVLPDALADRFADPDTDLVAELFVENGLELPVELDLSVAGRTADLRTAAAALTTPVEIPAAAAEGPGRITRSYLLAPELLAAADSVVFSGRASLPGGGIVTVRGSERVVYELRLRARMPR